MLQEGPRNPQYTLMYHGFVGECVWFTCNMGASTEVGGVDSSLYPVAVLIDELRPDPQVTVCRAQVPRADVRFSLIMRGFQFGVSGFWFISGFDLM